MALAGTPEIRNAECSACLLVRRRVSAAMIAQGNSESPPVLARIRKDRTWPDRDLSAPPKVRPPGHSDTPDPRGRPSWTRGGRALGLTGLSWVKRCLGQGGEYS